MHRRSALFLAMGLLLLFPLGTSVLSAAGPEEVGLSSERLARIGQALTRQIEARSFPGAVAHVARKGRIAYFESFGQLDPKTGSPMTKDAIFRLYSMTKPFTSVAAMMLVEDGRLRLTDPVGTYLPELAKLNVVVQGPDADGHLHGGPGAAAGDRLRPAAPHVRDRVRRLHRQPVPERALRERKRRVVGCHAGRAARGARQGAAGA